MNPMPPDGISLDAAKGNEKTDTITAYLYLGFNPWRDLWFASSPTVSPGGPRLAPAIHRWIRKTRPASTAGGLLEGFPQT